MRRRLLLVAPFAPRRDGVHGGAQAVHGLASVLAERHELVLVHLLADERPVDPDLAERCRAVHPVALPRPAAWTRRPRWALALASGRSLLAAESGVPQLRRRVREVSRSFVPDVVQVEFRIIGDVLAAAGDAMRVLTVHDPAASVLEGLPVRSPALPFVHRLDVRASLREERRALRRADVTVAFTERDRRLLARSVGSDGHVATIPLGWDVPATALDPAGSTPPVLVFVGNFNHPPNVDAAVRLARTILPRVRALHPETVLELVGAAPPAAVRDLAGPAVRVTGAVPSVRPHLERATVVVAPITIGGGMRVKVLEALAAGKAVVASPRAAEGVTARAGEEIALAEGAGETAHAIVRLLDDPGARRSMAARARAWALRELSWSAMGERYEELYARAERRRTGGRRRTR